MAKTIKQLLAERKRIDAELEKAEKRIAVIDEVKELLTKHGMTAAQLIAELQPTTTAKGKTKGDGPKRDKAKPMYRHPDNPRQTWSGPPRPKPEWVQKWIAEGGDIEETKVED